MKKILATVVLALAAGVAHAEFIQSGPSEWCKGYMVAAGTDAAAIKTAIEGDAGITTAVDEKGVVFIPRFGLLLVYMDAEPSAAEEALIDGHAAS